MVPYRQSTAFFKVGFDEDPSIYVLRCLISNFEDFRLLDLELFEALLLIKKLLIIKNLSVSTWNNLDK